MLKLFKINIRDGLEPSFLDYSTPVLWFISMLENRFEIG